MGSISYRDYYINYLLYYWCYFYITYWWICLFGR